MNTWGYLILIAALLLLAAAMLYARFASRSREKSLHHAPVELMFPYETISAARPPENETGRIALPRGGSKSGPEIKVERVIPPADSKEEGKGNSKERQSDYFDELQEAAAGLAMLMRSSPVGRSEPVIFAPEETEETEEETPEVDGMTEVEGTVAALEAEVGSDEIPAAEEPAEVCELDEEFPAALEEECLTLESADVVGESAPDEITLIDTGYVPTILTEFESANAEVPVEEEEECEVSLPVEVRVLTMREILGDQVSDRIGQIDEGLDALEALVRSIESSLRALDSVDLVDEDDEVADAEGAIVSEAA